MGLAREVFAGIASMVATMAASPASASPLRMDRVEDTPVVRAWVDANFPGSDFSTGQTVWKGSDGVGADGIEVVMVAGIDLCSQEPGGPMMCPMVVLRGPGRERVYSGEVCSSYATYAVSADGREVSTCGVSHRQR